MERPSPRRAAKRGSGFYAVLGLALVLGLAGVYYYFRFTRIIDAVLMSRAPQNTALYTRPYRIRVGQELSLEAHTT